MRWALNTDELRSIEIGLRGKLRSAQISEAFISRHLDDLLQQAVTEYANARERGIRIVNPAGWIVHTAHLRAIDQLRHEQHEVEGTTDDAALDMTDQTTPLPDEEALGHIEAEQLHHAIARLSTSQRQALSVYYFEERTTRDGADALGWSEATFRRRRDAAIKSLRERLGVTVPEFDIGLAAWLSLTTSDSRLTSIAGNLSSASESIRSGTFAVLDRTRDIAARIFSSGGGETAIGVASPAGKTAAGICAAAVAACTATGVIGPGVAGIDLVQKGNGEKAGIERQVVEQPSPPPQPARREPTTVGERNPDSGTPQESNQRSSNNRRQAQSNARRERAKRAESEATSQFGVESEASSAAPVTPAPTPTQTAPTPSASPTPDQSAQQQFGLP
jgi:RNA polymerase sigma factor (sigma-70 family)